MNTSSTMMMSELSSNKAVATANDAAVVKRKLTKLYSKFLSQIRNTDAIETQAMQIITAISNISIHVLKERNNVSSSLGVLAYLETPLQAKHLRLLETYIQYLTSNFKTYVEAVEQMRREVIFSHEVVFALPISLATNGGLKQRSIADMIEFMDTSLAMYNQEVVRKRYLLLQITDSGELSASAINQCVSCWKSNSSSGSVNRVKINAELEWNNI